MTSINYDYIYNEFIFITFCTSSFIRGNANTSPQNYAIRILWMRRRKNKTIYWVNFPKHVTEIELGLSAFVKKTCLQYWMLVLCLCYLNSISLSVLCYKKKSSKVANRWLYCVMFSACMYITIVCVCNLFYRPGCAALLFVMSQLYLNFQDDDEIRQCTSIVGVRVSSQIRLIMILTGWRFSSMFFLLFFVASAFFLPFSNRVFFLVLLFSVHFKPMINY